MEENEWQEMMKNVILDMEAQIGEHLSKGHTPTAAVMTDSSIRQIEEFCGVTIDWSNPIINLGDGEVPLRIYRTVDLKNGQVRIL